MTALGPIEPGALGLTLHHAISRPTELDDPDGMVDGLAAALAELEDAFQVGLRSIVDMTTADTGRDMRDVVWVTRRAPVHIILATVYHGYKKEAPTARDAVTQLIAETFIRELTDGIDGSDVRAGVIWAGTSFNEITTVKRSVPEAAAIAQLATGGPIETHTGSGTMALEQVEALRNAGADLTNVAIGHLDDDLDERYLRSVLETGVFIFFDQVSMTENVSDTDRAAMLKRLIDSGHLSQLLVSGNLAQGGGSGLRYLVERFPLVMMEAGLTAEQVRAIYIDNPARLLTISPPSN
jgi:phosphotriesterase-related protein